MGVHKLAVMQREQLWKCTLHLLQAIKHVYIEGWMRKCFIYFFIQ